MGGAMFDEQPQEPGVAVGGQVPGRRMVRCPYPVGGGPSRAAARRLAVQVHVDEGGVGGQCLLNDLKIQPTHHRQAGVV